MAYAHMTNRQGFTLLEISIVLVIISLLIGGILAGEQLIRTARNRSVIKQIEQINTSILTFSIKYDCLPGDCDDATSFFNGVTNGNGNGMIGGYANSEETGTVENWQIWTHLAAAGLIEGSYTGASGAGHTYRDANIGLNVPKLKNNEHIGIFLGFWGLDGSVSGAGFSGINHHVLQVGADMGDCCELFQPAFSAPDNYYMDVKIDDGFPNSGTVLDGHARWYISNPECNINVAGNDFTSQAARYRTDSDNIGCVPLFLSQGF